MILDNISHVPFSGTAGDGPRVKTADPSINDAELVKSFMSGDEGSFAALVDRHVPAVYAFVYRYLGNTDDANDVTQEVFIRVWKHIKKFDTKRNFKTWIFAIAKNASLDFIKRKKPLLFSQIEEGESDLDTFLAPYLESGDLPDRVLERADMKQSLEVALGKLSPGYRTVLAMRYQEHLKFREIADVLGEPIDTVKSKHRRGLALLKTAFGETDTL
jgi:RNA polymerase sigma-70 factor, ECF subfamily